MESLHTIDGTQFSPSHRFATWCPDARETGQATAVTTVALGRHRTLVPRTRLALCRHRTRLALMCGLGDVLSAGAMPCHGRWAVSLCSVSPRPASPRSKATLSGLGYVFLISFVTVKTLGDVCRDLKKDSRIQYHVCLALHQSVHR